MVKDKPYQRWRLPIALLVLFGLAFAVWWFSPAQQRKRRNAALRPQETIPVVLDGFIFPAIQQDFGLSDEQLTKITKVAKEKEEKMAQAIRELPKIARGKGANWFQEQKASHDMEAKNALKEILRPEQFKRFEQLMLHGLMVRAFRVPEVEESLQLSLEQKERINAIRDELQARLQPFQKRIESGGPPRDLAESEALLRDTDPLDAEALEKVLALLTAEQKSLWKKMIGEPFKPIAIKAAQPKPSSAPSSLEPVK